MSKTRFLMIGGFLGAGKTTAIARLARHYTEQGKCVGLVTNDQAYGLVDTRSLRAQGFDVGEVPGACFCCRFDQLVETAAKLGADRQPDIILTEPVGSCTDLVATVLHPLQHLFGDRYELGPLAVLCKPEHGRKILGGGTAGFSPQAAYIFLKQLEEAQLIVLNKIDRLSTDERADLLKLLGERFPAKRVLAISATDGEGFEEFISAIEEPVEAGELALDIDYDTYAQGEAALAWLNGGAEFRCVGGEAPDWSMDALVTEMVELLSRGLLSAQVEPGHVKVLAASAGATAVANWVASDAPVELSVASGAEVQTADVLVNVRVHGDPDQLKELVRLALDEIAAKLGLDHSLTSMQHFRPGRPEPVHRYATPQG